MEEDPSLRLEHSKDTHQMVLWGQGEMHLRVSLERLKRKYGVDAESHRRQVPYKETIKKGVEVRGRHKKQSGGHGQFGDVVLDIKPLPRGIGLPVRRDDHRRRGAAAVHPLGGDRRCRLSAQGAARRFPGGGRVGDADRRLLPLGRLLRHGLPAGRPHRHGEGMPKCNPVLLEPIMEVEIAIPNEATARVNGMIPQRRGQILGFDAREGWPGWDVVKAHMPESEMADLIVELRSATAGVGTYTAKFHHLAELTGRLADNVLAAHKQAAE